MITAIVQARMGAKRLPGKVLKEVMGKPLLGYQMERLRTCQRLDGIILATTNKPEDDRIAIFGEKEKLSVYRGSEDDVLDRYYQSARVFHVKHIMRITADCPLIDPALCDQLIEVYIKSGVDFVHTGPTYAEGVDCEIFSFSALEKAWCEAKLKSEREHVTLYMHNHSELFKKITLDNETDDSKYRFTVDEKEDIIVVREIIEKLYMEGKQPLSTNDIKMFLDTHQDTYKLNAEVIRNEGLQRSLEEDQLHEST